MKEIDWRDEKRAEELNRRFEAALETGLGPSGFIWRGCESTNKKMSPYALDHSRAKDAHADSLRVSREPCARCGVRGDVHDQYGCGR